MTFRINAIAAALTLSFVAVSAFAGGSQSYNKPGDACGKPPVSYVAGKPAWHDRDDAKKEADASGKPVIHLDPVTNVITTVSPNANANANAAANAAANGTGTGIGTGGSGVGTGGNAAQQQLAEAKQSLDNANANYNSVMANPNASAQQQQAAKAAVDNAQSSYNSIALQVQGSQSSSVAGGANVSNSTASFVDNRATVIQMQPRPVVYPAVNVPVNAVSTTFGCGPLRVITKKPLEVFFVGHLSESKVTLAGLDTESLAPVMEAVFNKDGTPHMVDDSGREVSAGGTHLFREQKYEVVDNGDGTISWYGAAGTRIALPVPASIMKSFGISFGDKSKAAAGDSAVSSALTVFRDTYALERCEFRRFQVKPAVGVSLGVSQTVAPAVTGYKWVPASPARQLTPQQMKALNNKLCGASLCRREAVRADFLTAVKVEAAAVAVVK